MAAANPLFSDDYLNHLLTRGEIDLSEQIPCILYRFSLAVTQGTSVYTLPSGIIGIHRITWRGNEIDPWEHADDQRSDWIKPQNQYSEGKPKIYLSYEYGFGKIKFHPVPHETIAADNTNIWSTGVDTLVVLTTYRIADPTGNTYRVPDYLRRRYNKYYALYRAYSREGKAQDLQAADYYKAKYDLIHNFLRDIIQKISPSVIQLGPSDPTSRKGKPARPVYPTDGAWSF